MLFFTGIITNSQQESEFARAEFYYWVDDDQVSIVGPGTQLHTTVLEVKGEMQHNDFTVALEDGRRVPRDQSSVLQQHFGLVNDGKVTVSAAGTDKHRRSINMGDNKLNVNVGGHQRPRMSGVGTSCCACRAGCQGKNSSVSDAAYGVRREGAPAIQRPDLA